MNVFPELSPKEGVDSCQAHKREATFQAGKNINKTLKYEIIRLFISKPNASISLPRATFFPFLSLE